MGKIMTKQKINQELILLFCHPYTFALKEGQSIKEDPLDYSLLLLQRHCVEVIRSPLLVKPKPIVPSPPVRRRKTKQASS
jgi:hypothetical protein